MQLACPHPPPRSLDEDCGWGLGDPRAALLPGGLNGAGRCGEGGLLAGLGMDPGRQTASNECCGSMYPRAPSPLALKSIHVIGSTFFRLGGRLANDAQAMTTAHKGVLTICARVANEKEFCVGRVQERERRGCKENAFLA